jgi:hypothetical protein
MLLLPPVLNGCSIIAMCITHSALKYEDVHVKGFIYILFSTCLGIFLVLLNPSKEIGKIISPNSLIFLAGVSRTLFTKAVRFKAWL